MQHGLTKTQLGYYFMPRYLKYFEPDLYIDFGNNYYMHFYNVETVKKVVDRYNIPVRPYDSPRHKRKDSDVWYYLSGHEKPFW